jgi:dTDP-4-amino-4,6-dideoxygalactose transaminase
MEGMQGAILRVKLRHLETWTEARRTHAARYNRALTGKGVGIPEEMSYARHVFHIYAIRTAQRTALIQQLNARNIQNGIHYPFPVHLLPAYADLGYKAGQFPHSEKAANEVLSLPMYAELPENAPEEVAEVIGAFTAR